MTTITAQSSAAGVLVGLTLLLATAPAGAQSWESRSNAPMATGVAFFDIDGTGDAETFAVPGDSFWHVFKDGSRLFRRGTQIRFSEMALGDFDGDGAADVLVTNGHEWKISKRSQASWERWRGSNLRLPALAFGDFDGDGRTDAFRTTSIDWQISRGANRAWQRLAARTDRLTDLAFGDFNGDGRTDVFRATGHGWEISSGGSGPWQRINSSSLRLRALRFADVDRDGRLDVIVPTAKSFAKRGNGALQPLPVGYRPRATHRGDWDGDGRLDSFQSPPSFDQIVEEVRKLHGAKPVIAGWSNEVKRGSRMKLMALGVSGTLVGWRLETLAGRVLFEHRLEPVATADSDRSPAAEKLERCARGLRACQALAPASPFCLLTLLFAPQGFIPCLFAQEREDHLIECLDRFQKCMAA